MVSGNQGKSEGKNPTKTVDTRRDGDDKRDSGQGEAIVYIQSETNKRHKLLNCLVSSRSRVDPTDPVDLLPPCGLCSNELTSPDPLLFCVLALYSTDAFLLHHLSLLTFTALIPTRQHGCSGCGNGHGHCTAGCEQPAQSQYVPFFILLIFLQRHLRHSASPNLEKRRPFCFSLRHAVETSARPHTFLSSHPESLLL